MLARTSLCAFPLVLALSAVACGDDAPASGGAPTIDEDPAAEPAEAASPPEEEIAPGDTIGREMQVRAQQFAQGMRPATPLFRGTLDTGGTQDYQAVLQGGRCFKILGVGSDGVTDLDLFLFDPNGVQVQQDTATDNYPVLGLTHPICPQEPGSYRVQVKMFAGQGDFGVRVYESQ